MGEVLRYPADGVKAAPRTQAHYHGDLPEGVVRLVHPAREVPSFSARAERLLLFAMVSDMPMDDRLRVRRALLSLFEGAADDEDIQAARRLLFLLPDRANP